MSYDNMLAEALCLLGEFSGGPLPAFDDEGLCVLAHDDGFGVTLLRTQGSDILLLSAQLIEVPQDGREALFAWLLRLNFLGLDTGGAALSLDEEERHVYLCHGAPLSRLDAPGLVTLIGNFIDAAASVRQRLLGEAPAVAADAALVPGVGWIHG